jgi:hypothetical protein
LNPRPQFETIKRLCSFGRVDITQAVIGCEVPRLSADVDVTLARGTTTSTLKRRRQRLMSDNLLHGVFRFGRIIAIPIDSFSRGTGATTCAV